MQTLNPKIIEVDKKRVLMKMFQWLVVVVVDTKKTSVKAQTWGGMNGKWIDTRMPACFASLRWPRSVRCAFVWSTITT